ncbi:MAG TPA: EamA family transporter, partial [Candidatus Saccharimonadia bacterium]|nr:EamA family transporter [Candidatus Saccharimonadia bacterium]
FYPGFFQIIWAILFTPIAFLADRKGFRELFSARRIKQLLPAGILDAVSVYAQFWGFVLALPAYVSAVGNSQILFSSFLGWYLFKEKIEKHVLPTIAIVAGIIMITIAQG